MWQTDAVRRLVAGWSKERVIETIKARADKGLSLATSQVIRESRVLYMAAGYFFGELGWQKAVEAAGFRPTQRRYQHWTCDTFVAELLSLHDKGVPLHDTYLSKNGYKYLVRTGQRLFGTWRVAIEFACLRYEQVKVDVQKWDKEKTVSAILSLAQANEDISPYVILLTHNDLFHAAIRHFGSWSQALAATGINYRLHYRIWSSHAWVKSLSDEDFKSLLRRTRSRKRQPTGRVTDKKGGESKWQEKRC